MLFILIALQDEDPSTTYQPIVADALHHKEVVEVLISHGADVNARREAKISPPGYSLSRCTANHECSAFVLHLY